MNIFYRKTYQTKFERVGNLTKKLIGKRFGEKKNLIIFSTPQKNFEELGQPRRNLHQSKSTFRSMTQPQFHSLRCEMKTSPIN